MKVKMELSPPWPRRGGRAINKMLRRHLIMGAAGVVGSTTAYFLTNTTPSAPSTVASQHSIDGAASPPRLRRGVSCSHAIFLCKADSFIVFPPRVVATL